MADMVRKKARPWFWQSRSHGRFLPLTRTKTSNSSRTHGNFITKKFVMADDLRVSTLTPIAVLVGIGVVIYKWAAGPKPIET